MVFTFPNFKSNSSRFIYQKDRLIFVSHYQALASNWFEWKGPAGNAGTVSGEPVAEK